MLFVVYFEIYYENGLKLLFLKYVLKYKIYNIKYVNWKLSYCYKKDKG